MRIALFSRFPEDLAAPRGGVETVTLALTRALVAMEDTDLHVITLERGRRSLAVTQELGATIHRLPGSRWPQMFEILFGPGRYRLKRYLRRLRPDVVHFHETYGLGIGRLPMPSVFTVHGFDHANIPAEGRRLPWLRAPLWKRVEAWGLARQRHIISITPYVRRHIRPLTTARIYDIDNPIDPACFDIPRREVAGRVFFAGWISHRKNPLTLIQAFARVVEHDSKATLHIAGEQPDQRYAETVRNAIRELGLCKHVSMLGRLTPAEVRHELSEASVFALPSRQENAPMAISEAMASGVPVVSSNVCGMPFMVQAGRTGFLVDPENTDMLADRLTALLRDKALRTEMGDAARRVALERFHPDSVARKTREVYELLASEPGRGLPA